MIPDLMEFQYNKNQSLRDIVDLAVKENKLIFIDVYADWCLPCKNMDEDVFSKQGVAEFMNSNFINYKVDGEKFNGPDLGLQFDIGGYPTLLILDQRGQVVERYEGVLYQSGLKRMAKEAMKIVQEAS
jgi:thiol:disulfide interchange protein